MANLTIQQRDLLRELLDADSPVAIAEIGRHLDLTPRQVSYRLKPVKRWLAKHDISLKSTPGVGLEVDCSSIQRHDLLQELETESLFDINLTAGQRQQLFAFTFLTNPDPVIVNWLQHVSDVSRTTVFKDLEPIEDWLAEFNLSLIRRPNYGLLLDGTEVDRRQALTALLWGEVPFDSPLTAMTHDRGLTFTLSTKTTLPLIQQTVDQLSHYDTRAALEWVAHAEADFGGRFTDDAVLHLALALAIKIDRVRAGYLIQADEIEGVEWLIAQKVWPVAVNLTQSIWPDLDQETLHFEIGGLAIYLLAGLRDHMWPGDLDIDPALTGLITSLMEEVAAAFNTPGLRHDSPLRDGLVAHIIPAIMRQRFQLWAPSSWSDGALARKYAHEYNIANELASMVAKQTGVTLPAGEIDTLALLLRAAFIRERPHRAKRVFIICPSGMATAQLLVARLRARFPSLDILGVLSQRELSSERIAGAQLLISTVPLESPRPDLHVIQVHPLLLPEDIDRITHWLI